MRIRRVTVGLLLISAAALSAQDNQAQQDWAQLQRYRQANAELRPVRRGENRVVFYGNSITEGWARHFDAMFPGKPYIGRGIGGQTTPQMLVRFRQDVIALKPKVVVILAGTNDIAGNTGPITLERIEGNMASMVDLAHTHGIRVVFASILPVSDYNRFKAMPDSQFPGSGKLPWSEFVRTIAVARILMPASVVRLSAGRAEMSEAAELQKSMARESRTEAPQWAALFLKGDWERALAALEGM